MKREEGFFTATAAARRGMEKRRKRQRKTNNIPGGSARHRFRFPMSAWFKGVVYKKGVVDGAMRIASEEKNRRRQRW